MRRNLIWIALSLAVAVAGAASLGSFNNKAASIGNAGPHSLAIAGTGSAGTPPTPASQPSGLSGALAEQDPVLRERLLDQGADSIAVNDLGDQLAHPAGFAEGKLKAEVRAALLRSWCRRDLAGAVRWFDRLRDVDALHDQARDAVASALAARNPAAMVSWMKVVLPVESQRQLFSPFFRDWATTDPASAALALRQLLGSKISSETPDQDTSHWNDLVAQVAAQWATTDVNSAVYWVQSLPTGPAKAQAMVQVSYRWTQENPQAAAAYAAQQNDPSLLKAVAGKWAESDPKTAANWALTLPGDGPRDAALSTLGTTWAQNDPVAAASFAASLPPGSTQSQVVGAVISTWASTQPNETAQWVDGFPEGATREHAVDQLINVWASNSPEDAAQWLKNLPDTPSRDVAIKSYVGVVDGETPNLAFQWAQTISDPTLRDQQLHTVVGFWAKSDPTAAQSQINQSNLPPDLKSALLANAAGQP